MTPSRSRTIWFVALGTLMYASLQPGTALEDYLDRALLPARVAGELVRPLAWLARDEVNAAEPDVVATEAAYRARALAVLAREQEHALPEDLELIRGRGFVHAQVVERNPRTPDRVTVQFDPRAPIAPGMPVAAGDVFIGRVGALSRDRAGEAFVDLVTEKSFRVGACVGAPDGTQVELVVGGVAAGLKLRRDELHLAVHAPSARGVEKGTVRVLERDVERGLDPWRGLANGFRLGEWSQLAFGGANVPAVRAEIDLAAGPYQVVALTRPEMAEAGAPLACDPFDVARWIPTRSLAPGAASTGREGRVLAHGRRAGIGDGAALRRGSVFLGRVARAGEWTSSARLVGDAGFEVHALAEIEGVDAPLPLGVLVSRGRDGAELELAWENRIDADAGDAAPLMQRAEIYTGGGDRSVPAGLHLGSAMLPRARGEHVLRVKPRLDARTVLEVEAWRTELAPPDALEPANAPAAPSADGEPAPGAAPAEDER